MSVNKVEFSVFESMKYLWFAEKKTPKTNADDMLDKQRKNIPQDWNSGNPERVLVFENLWPAQGYERVWKMIQVKQHWGLQILLREMALKGSWGRYKEETKHAKWLPANREINNHMVHIQFGF